VDGVRVAEQVVQIAQDLLVAPTRKTPEAVRRSVEGVSGSVRFTSRRSMN
jgi:hypothetical protein